MDNENSLALNAKQRSDAFTKRFAGGILLTIVMVIALAGYLLSQSYVDSQARAEMETQNLSKVLEGEITAIIGKSELALHTVADEVRTEMAGGGISEKKLTAFLARQQERLPEIQSFRATDARGIVAYGLGVKPGSKTDLSDRDFFIHARENADDKAMVSKPVFARISKTWVVPISMRLSKADGSFFGVAYINIALEQFARIFAPLIVGKHGVIALFDSDLAIVTRYPEAEQLGSVIGRKYTSLQLGSLIRAGHDSGTYIAPSSIDGRVRTFSYQKVQGQPLYVIIGLDRQEYLAGWHKEVIATSVLLALFLLITLTASTLVYRSWKARESTAAALRESEMRLRQITDNMVDMVGRFDERAYFQYASPSYERVLGYQPAELIGNLATDFIHPDEKDIAIQAIDAMLKSGKGSVQFRYRHKDGTYRWVESTGSNIMNEQGRTIGSTLGSRDITQRKLTDLALQESERKYRAIIDNISDTYYRTGLDGTILLMSPSATALFGYSSIDELIGMKMAALWQQPELRNIMLEKIRSEGSVKDYEVIFQKSDGSPLTVSVSSKFYLDESGMPAGVEGVIRDITERKRAEEALRDSEEKYRLLVETASSIILTWDTAGKITFMNEHGERFFGFSKNELIGRNIIGTIVPEVESSGRDLRTLMQAIQNTPDLFRDNENENITKDGRRVWVRWANKMILDRQGNITGILSIGNDITARRFAEAALREKTSQLEDLTRNLERRVAEEIVMRTRNEQMLVQQSKLAAMGEMLGAIAHQWRQPLNALGLIIQNIRDAYTHGELDRAYLDRTVQKAMSQVQHMSETIDDFRRFFQPDKEQATFDTMHAVGDVLSLFLAQLAANEIDFQLICQTHGKTFTRVEDIAACPAKTITGFQNEFEHVMMNLINNAREAIIERRESGRMNRDGRGLIVFVFRNDGGKLVIEVIDNGGGIPEHILDRIFEPYFTTKDPAKGTGLGLYMSKVIIESHMGGKLTAKNSAQGAVFAIELPTSGERIRA